MACGQTIFVCCCRMSSMYHGDTMARWYRWHAKNCSIRMAMLRSSRASDDPLSAWLARTRAIFGGLWAFAERDTNSKGSYQRWEGCDWGLSKLWMSPQPGNPFVRWREFSLRVGGLGFFVRAILLETAFLLIRHYLSLNALVHRKL